MRIEMEGRQAADEWKRDAERLNQDTQKLLNQVSDLLKSVREFSEGTLVDEIYDLGTNLVTATTKLMEGMNKIYDVIDGLLKFLAQLFTGSSASTKEVNSFINS